MAQNRIIAADSFNLVPDIVRSTMALVERTAVIIEVSSGDAALDEIQRGGVDLIVIGHALDDMRGLDLALQAHRADENLPMVLLTGASDPILDAGSLDDAPFYYLIRAEDGAQFTRILCALLDGTDPSAAVVGDDATPGVAMPNLGPIPEVNVSALSDVMAPMLTDVGAMAMVLVDRSGNILHEMGAVGYLDREKLTTTLAPVVANMQPISQLVGGKPQAINFYDGSDFDIFALTVGYHHFVCLIFEGSAGSRAFGSVTMFGRRSIKDMIDIIGDDAFIIQAGAAPAPPPKAKRQAPKRKKPAAQKATAPAPPAPPAPKPATSDAVPRPPSLEPMPDDADLDSLLAGLAGVDANQADDLFNPDKLAEIAAETMAGERLTYEEAQQMGVLQK